MNRLFQKIRKQLLSENQFSKYLLYAIGEIALIVVGILLALQISNWNDARKEAKLELKILKGLYEDLEINHIELKNMVEGDSLVTLGNQKLIEILQDEQITYRSSMDTLFGNMISYSVFFPQSIAYETLKSKGLDILKNESLRSRIAQLYDNVYLIASHLVVVKKEQQSQATPILLKYLVTKEDRYHKRPNNFQALKKNDEFLNLLTHICAEQENFVDMGRTILEFTINAKNLVAKEIKRIAGKL